jgi:hypothetical protein
MQPDNNSPTALSPEVQCEKLGGGYHAILSPQANNTIP